MQHEAGLLRIARGETVNFRAYTHGTIIKGMAKLNDTELAAALDSLPGWTLVNGKMHREYSFADFVHAFGFMATAAIAIEAMEHHPEWSNVWNRVTIDLTTHDLGGITPKDVLLANKLEAIAQKLLG